MPGIKQLFKNGLKKAATKTTDALIGTPEQRAIRADQEAHYKAAREAGRKQGRLKAEFQLGYKEGKAKAGGQGGALGMLVAGAKGLEDGLNAGAGVLGIQPEREERRSRKRHRSHSRVNDDIIF